MNKITELIEKTVGLDQHEWEELTQEARDVILKLCELKEEPQESKSKLAEGIKKVLDLHPDEYGELPQYQRDKLLQKVNDILG